MSAHSPYRTIATRDVKPSFEEADAYEDRLRVWSRRSVHRTSIALFATIALTVIGALASYRHRRDAQTELTKARASQRLADALAAVDESDRLIVEEQSRFESTLLDILREQPPTQALAHTGNPCPIELPKTASFGASPFSLLVVSHGDSNVKSAALEPLAMRVRHAREQLEGGRPQGLFLAKTLDGLPKQLTHEVVLVTTERRPARRVNTTTFEPGEVAGRAYVYDFNRHAVVCAGDIRAKSSEKIAYTFVPTTAVTVSSPAALDQNRSLASTLDVDLQMQVVNEIASGRLQRVD